MLRFCESCGHWTTVAQQTGKWTGTISFMSTTAGRRGGNAINNPALTRIIDAQGSWILGCAFQLPGLGVNATPFLQLLDSGTTQIDVRGTGTAGAIIITRNGTVLATSAVGVVPVNTWFYLELKAVIAPSTGGSVAARINGTVVASATGINSSATGTSTANTVGIAAPINGTLACDFYACDGTGSVNNDYLGDVAVKCLLPTSDGTYTQWTPNSGTAHFSRVNEAASDDDTSYNSTSTVNNIDTYHCTTLAAGVVYGVQPIFRTRIDDAGPHSVAPVIRQGGTDYVGTAQSESATYSAVRQLYEQDPNTSAAWTTSGVNSAEFGIKMVS